MPVTFSLLVRRGLPLFLALAVLGGCKRKEARVYTAPKDVPFNPEPQQPQQTAQTQDPAARQAWRPALKYALPSGWKDLGPDAANVAQFHAAGASVAVTALGSMQGEETLLVNLWRQMRGQPPLDDAEATKMLTEVPIAGAMGKMFEVTDTEGGQARSFVVAFVHRPEGSLFFKIQGEAAAVTAQKPAFFELLKTIQIVQGSTPAPQASVAPEPAPDDTPAPAPANLPPGWKVLQPGAMQVAKFAVPEKDGGKAEVAISIFPNDTGGLASNVKRWRGQLGLPEVDDAAAAAAAKPIEGAPEGAVLVELENQGRGLIGAIVPRDGKWWFYKMMGDAPAVFAARDSFVTFAKAQQ